MSAQQQYSFPYPVPSVDISSLIIPKLPWVRVHPNSDQQAVYSHYRCHVRIFIPFHGGLNAKTTLARHLVHLCEICYFPAT